MAQKQFNTKKIFTNVLWALLGMGTVVLLGAAINIKNNRHCKGVEINITGAENNFFIDKNKVNNILLATNGGVLQGETLASFDLFKLENVLQKNAWINNAEVFFDNNEVLRVNVKERQPIARIFTVSGTSFYIDSAITRLPLSDKFSARVPVFTDFNNTQTGALTKADSSLLYDIKTIGTYILKDPFWMAQIDQIDITPERNFEMVPKVGNQIISFGSADNYAEKFNKLLIFYKQVESNVGWNKYSKLNVQYKDQLIAVKRGAQDIILDSLRAKQIMQAIVANAQKQANDSINNIQLVQPQEDNNIPVASQIENVPEEKISIDKPVTPAAEKAIPLSTEKPNPAPEVVPEKKVPSPIPANKISHPFEKPFWLRAADARPANAAKKVLPVNKKIVTVKKKPSSTEKPNPIPSKKIVIKKAVIRSAEKPKTKPIVKPKAETPPANDY